MARYRRRRIIRRKPSKKKIKAYRRVFKTYTRIQQRKYTEGYKRARDFNRRHRVVGPSMDYLVSPYDAIPGVALYTKGKRAYKLTKRAYRGAKAGYRGYKKNKKRSQSSRPSNKPSRKRSTSSSQSGRRRRDTYYYYRGRRIRRSQTKRRP